MSLDTSLFQQRGKTDPSKTQLYTSCSSSMDFGGLLPSSDAQFFSGQVDSGAQKQNETSVCIFLTPSHTFFFFKGSC